MAAVIVIMAIGVLFAGGVFALTRLTRRPRKPPRQPLDYAEAYWRARADETPLPGDNRWFRLPDGQYVRFDPD